MYFYVHFNPEIINRFVDDELSGNQLLIPLFRNFTINCFLLDFLDYRDKTSYQEYLDKLPTNSLRSELKKIYGVLYKRNRIIPCLTVNYNENISDTESVISQAKEKNIDIIIVDNNEEIENITECECCYIEEVSNSEFEKKRFAFYEGKIFLESEESETDFLNKVFYKGLKYADEIEFFDKIFGKRFSDNYEYTTAKIFKWLNNVLNDQKKCTIKFHCEEPDGVRSDFIKEKLKEFKTKYLPHTKIIIQFYKVLTVMGSMHHERYILTNQIALELGRGMDMLNRNTGRNRDSKYSYTNKNDLKKLIDNYSGNRLPEIII